MKLGVIGGAGVLGSTTAFYVAMNNLVDEIVLYDIRENYAINHAMDLDQGVCGISSTTVSAGGLDDLKGCDIILNTAGVPEGGRVSRDEYLIDNLPIYMALAENIKTWGYYPIIISTSNPMDVLNYKLYEAIGGPRGRYLALCWNDTLRFKWAIAKELGLPATLVDAIVLGEHGAFQVPVYTSAKRKDTGEAIVLTDEQHQSVQARISSWFKNVIALKTQRTMGWTSGIGLGTMIEAIVKESETVIPVSCIPDGEYGLSGVSLGLPVRLCKEGVREIVEIYLDDEERKGLKAASDKIKSLIYQ